MASVNVTMSNNQTVMKLVIGLQAFVLSAVIAGVDLAAAGDFSHRSEEACESSLFKPHNTVSPRQLLSMANWLNREAHRIDIHTTHLEPLVPLLLSLKKSMDRAEPHTLLRLIQAEIDRRISNRNVTYEYLFCLPFRVGFVLHLQDGMIPGVFDSTYPENYLTHESFSGFLEANLRRKGNMNSMILTSIYEDLRKFPKAKFLLYPGDLNYEDINQLMARDVWPIGIPMKHVYADGVRFTPLLFAFHDLSHWSQFYESPFKPDQLEISPEKVKELEPYLLRAIESQVVSHQDLRVLHFIHFHLFHETTRREFQFRIDDKLMFPSQYSLAGGLKHVLKMLKYSLSSNSKASDYIRDDFQQLLTESSEAPASVAERNINLYIKLIDKAAAKVPL